MLTPVAVRVGGLPWLPKFLPQIVRFDRLLQRATRGRVTLLDVAGLPNLVLTVPGRRSGLPRSTPLLCVPRGDAYLVAGSNFGGPQAPAWVTNLEAAGAGTLQVGGETRTFRSRPVTGDERATAWTHMLRTWPHFATYERRTSRTIEVFELVPVDGSSSAQRRSSTPRT